MTDRTATLTFSDGSPSVEFPILTGTIGPDVIDIRTLYGKTGKFTYDPGFLSTAACNSAITYIDGDKGELLYRGYPIEQLAVNCDFLETCYLLLNGELPTRDAEGRLRPAVTNHTMVHEQMQFFLRGFRRDAHPMAVLVGARRRAVGVLSRLARHQRPAPARHLGDPPDRQDADARGDGVQVLGRPAVHVSAQRPVVRGELHAHDVRDAVRGLQVERRAGARAGPHLHPARRPRAERVDVDRAPVRARRAPTRSPCIAAGIACLWGPAHGGANEAALNMLYEIQKQGGVGQDRRVHRQGQGQELAASS